MDPKLSVFDRVPYLSLLSIEHRSELLSLMMEENFEPGDVIVTKGNLIDSVFIIVEGIANVIIDDEVVAILSAGDSIGLSEISSTGFYSGTGYRTATVVALTEIMTLKLSIENLSLFLSKHPHFASSMNAAAKKFMRIAFIKNFSDFATLPQPVIACLAEELEEVSLKKGEVLFKEGELGDICYFINEGEVDLFTGIDGENKIATLKKGALFGEMATLDKLPRNANAVAATDCELLALNGEHLRMLINDRTDVKTVIAHLMLKRTRPKRNPHVTVQHITDSKGNVRSILKNEHGQYFQLSEYGYFIWNQLNGHLTIKEIVIAFYNQFRIFSIDTVFLILYSLRDAGFIELRTLDIANERQGNFIQKIISYLANILEYQITFSKNVNEILKKSFNQCGHWFFTKPALVIGVLTALVGLINFVFFTERALALLEANTSVAWWLVILTSPASIFIVVLHELAHAYTAIYYGRHVHGVGIGWYWYEPVAFADVSDVWLADRKTRLAVDCAGFAFDFVCAGVLAILASFFFKGIFALFLWLLALTTYLRIFANLNPWFEYDGYYALMDWWEMANLRLDAVLWLIKDFPRIIKKPQELFISSKEIAYWVLCIVYSGISVIIMYWLQLRILWPLLGLEPSFWISSILPLLFLGLSLYAVYSEAKQFSYSLAHKKG